MVRVLSRVRASMLAAALAAASAALFCFGSASAQDPGQVKNQLPPAAAVAQPAQDGSAAQEAPPQSAQQAAVDCPGHPDAIGTSRVLAIDPADLPRVGRMQYADSLPLNDKEVVLTFDDGPLLPYSNQILDILAAQCVKATYFLVGEMARAFPATVRRIYEEGHTIGTHSEDHPTRFGQLPLEKMRQEIDWGISDVGAALGDIRYLAPFFRIPGLARSDLLESELSARGLTVFSSDTVADDWHHRIGAKGITAAAMHRLEAAGKGILLLHDIHPKTVAALPGILKELKDKGFHIVHVVPAASYVIAMASKPKARLVASTLTSDAVIGEDPDRGGPPRWPEAVVNVALGKSALPVPDAATFEPDAVASQEVGDVQWPAHAIAPPEPKVQGHKHRSAHADKRKGHVAHAGSEQHRTEHARPRRERARASADGHRADTSSRPKSLSALVTPAQAAAH